MLRLGAAAVLGAICLGQTPPAKEPLRWPYPGLVPPKLVKRVAPQYSKEGLEVGVQGISLYEIVIDEQGLPTTPRLLSPLGYGLDERAREAVEQWRFEPARLNGEPVRVYGRIEVGFRLRDTQYNVEVEYQRTEFNRSMDGVKRGGEDRARAIESILKLSKEGMPAALHAEATWLISGSLGSPDPDRGRTLLKEAANRNYPPALYEYGLMQVRGEGVEMDQKRGLNLIRDASKRGNTSAQFFLGRSYESGSLVERDRDKAMSEYQLCAARAVPLCQYRLAKLLLDKPKRREGDLLQAVAWLQLAAGHGVQDARQDLHETLSQCTPEQLSQIDRLRPMLERQPIQVGRPDD